MAASRRTFVVGRLTPRTTEIRLVDLRPAPLAGPFALRAVVAAREPLPASRGK